MCCAYNGMGSNEPCKKHVCLDCGKPRPIGGWIAIDPPRMSRLLHTCIPSRPTLELSGRLREDGADYSDSSCLDNEVAYSHHGVPSLKATQEVRIQSRHTRQTPVTKQSMKRRTINASRFQHRITPSQRTHAA